MTQSNQIQLAEMLQQFNHLKGDLQDFHKNWVTFLAKLSKDDAQLATRKLMNSMLTNVQQFKNDAVEFAALDEKNRQIVANMTDEVLAHPAFTTPFSV